MPGIPQLTQSKAVDAATAVIGQTLTYSMSVGNTGSADATGVSAQDLLPAGVTFVGADTGGIGSTRRRPASGPSGRFPQGASYTLTVTATVNQGTDDTTLINRFTVTARPEIRAPSSSSPVPTTRAHSCATTWIPGTPQLVVSKTVNTKSAAVGAALDLYHHDDQHRDRGRDRRRGPGIAAFGADADVGEYERVGHVRSRHLALVVPLVSPGATATLTLVGTVLPAPPGR